MREGGFLACGKAGGQFGAVSRSARRRNPLRLNEVEAQPAAGAKLPLLIGGCVRGRDRMAETGGCILAR